MKWLKKIIGVIGAGLLNLGGPIPFFKPAVTGITGMEIALLMGGAGALLGGGAQVASSFGGGGGGVPGMASGYDVVNLPTYDFTEPRFESMSNFVQNQFDSINSGGVPAWLEQTLPKIRSGLNRELEQTYFGLPGQRTGVIPSALQASAITGAGAGTANRQVSRQLQNYGQQSQRIDEFIAQEQLQGTQETIRSAGQIGLGIPQGPPAQVVSYGGYAPQPGPDYGSSIASAMQGLGQMGTAAMGMFGQGGAIPGVADPYMPQISPIQPYSSYGSSGPYQPTTSGYSPYGNLPERQSSYIPAISDPRQPYSNLPGGGNPYSQF